MIIIQTALHLEAKLLIDALKLKKDVGFKAFDIFTAEHTRLIISGIGQANAAAATSSILTKTLEDTNQESIHILNFGLAGATDNFNISDLVLANKIIDITSDSAFYPDLIYKSDLIQATLNTFPKPVKASEHQLDNCIVDMEASGYFAAATKFLAPHQIHCIKIVADHLDPKFFDKDFTEELINKRLDQILNYIQVLKENTKQISASTSSVVETNLEQELENIVLDLRLSSSQKQNLLTLATQYETITQTSIAEFLKLFHYPKSAHKSANKMIFQKLQTKLEIEIQKHVEQTT